MEYFHLEVEESNIEPLLIAFRAFTYLGEVKQLTKVVGNRWSGWGHYWPDHKQTIMDLLNPYVSHFRFSTKFTD